MFLVPLGREVESVRSYDGRYRNTRPVEMEMVAHCVNGSLCDVGVF